MPDKQGILIVFSGPSGSGKDTVLSEIIRRNPGMKVSTSMTTRKIRDNETDGADYYFVDRDYFEKKIKDGSMLEYAEYSGNYYGTPKAPVDDMLGAGIDVVLKIEVCGADKIRKLYPDVISIFLMPPSLAALEERIRSRGTEDEESISHRLFIAEQEMRRVNEYGYVIINDTVDNAVEAFETIIRAEKSKVIRNKNILSEVTGNV